MNLKYLEGLNALRFIAAFLVVIRHAYESCLKIGVLHEIRWTVLFERGLAAVDFFFTLSGFLITYLLIQEYNATGAVSLKRFYLRRICRIWPLYFIVLAIGFALFTVVYPRLFHQQYFNFNPLHGLLFYLFFLPHWMAAHYQVGLLLPLWSIGVEEQFYLFWAPLVKRFARHLIRLILVFIAVTAAFQLVATSGLVHWDETTADFVRRLRFHYMAVGCLFAWILYYRGTRYLSSPFASRPAQLAVIGVLTYHYIIGFPASWGVPLDLVLALGYGLLILNVSVLPNRLFNLEREPLKYLGTISYGIYMYHMLADYAVRMVFVRLHFDGVESWYRFAVYGTACLGITILLAAFSYRYFESRFLAFSRGQRTTAALRSLTV